MTALTKQVAGSHYKSLPIQPVEFCQRNGLGFCESSVVKYVARHREKNGRQDIEKAIHFLELLLELEYSEASVHVGVDLAKGPDQHAEMTIFPADDQGRSCGTCMHIDGMDDGNPPCDQCRAKSHWEAMP